MIVPVTLTGFVVSVILQVRVDMAPPENVRLPVTVSVICTVPILMVTARVPLIVYPLEASYQLVNTRVPVTVYGRVGGVPVVEKVTRTLPVPLGLLNVAEPEPPLDMLDELVAVVCAVVMAVNAFVVSAVDGGLAFEPAGHPEMRIAAATIDAMPTKRVKRRFMVSVKTKAPPCK